MTPPTSVGTSSAARTDPGGRVGNGERRTIWQAVTGAFGVVSGLAPHVLHHVGFLAGTALVAGAGGTALFGAMGLVASVPFLLRLRRRFASWWAPAIALVVFTVMFSLSAFVVGPRISGTSGRDEAPSPTAPSQTVDHNAHHSG